MTFIIAARRSAIVPRGGPFARLSIEELAAPVLLGCLADAGISGTQVDELIVSNALGAGGNPARRVALAAGLPDRVAGLSIDRQCVGGLDALLIARAMVASGCAEVVLAGGVESYSRRPLRLRTDPDGGTAVPYDQPPFTPWPDRELGMAQAADALAARLGIGRSVQDDWAVRSHARALRNMAQIIEIAGITSDPFTRLLTPATAARARVITGTITAANAAVAADGAAFCLVVSARMAAKAGRAMRIVAGRTLGADPAEPGLAPVPAIAAALADCGLRAADLTLAEVMEAYAAQAIACVQGARLNPEMVNSNGGALARGHPIGASGAVLAVGVFHDLRAGHGLAAIAAAGGLGTAVIFGV